MSLRILTLSLTAAVALAVAGCASSTEQEKRAATGGLIGAGVGALAGQAIGGNTGATVAGAAGGAILGAVIGSATTPQGERYCKYRGKNGSIYTAPCPDGY
ncbi:MAG: glycine zipper 2TM domain-containing protein [Rhizobiaceae bacterium]|nr:glycine zipper 2TM domain-containing protein [Rhizobiaceae bacterium]